MLDAQDFSYSLKPEEVELIHVFPIYQDHLNVIYHRIVRGTSSASASDSHVPPAPATSSLFRNAFGRMTSYATRSRPPSAPDRMMSQDSSSRPDISSDPPSVYDTLTRHVCCTLHVFPNFGLISYIHYFVY